MSSQRPRAPRGHYKRFVSRGFCQLMNTTNLEKTICGLLFVLRFVTFSKHSNPGTDIRSNVVELFDQRNIQHSSVDFVRFSWVEDDEDAGTTTRTSRRVMRTSRAVTGTPGMSTLNPRLFPLPSPYTPCRFAIRSRFFAICHLLTQTGALTVVRLFRFISLLHLVLLYS